MPNWTFSRLPFLALAAVVASAVLGTPTHAAPRADNEVAFTYEAPEISDEGDHVTWHWALANQTDHPVSSVVLTSKITPQVPVTTVTEGCEVQDASTIVCTFPTMKAGENREGTIEADLPEDLQGSLTISGRVTWQNPETDATQGP
ncbi:hypothetical protein NFX46_18720 [Streptomyces phaeoluteigriseus]|uniref:DUF11 domain-containing protein n=1 Tax=Streptomyces phaeoluteigriseus TaxID=114686 RepID=A0ABY4Z982_9ACTN|nr:hypothetical protein [Streptomyces phaeoluteigriseus]USQ85619.1 hypothetical protein NFX46_18720 [Streptomyces phaeoluteigriseus]